MKKTLQIHIGGRHFHIDEDGYNKLNHYLESLKSHFAAEGDSGKEIVEDIEQRIAELLESKITENKQAISQEDVLEAIGILGKVEDFVFNGKSSEESEYTHYERRENRRFFRDGEKGYLGGVASGLGAYFDIDPLWIRLAFIILTIFNLAFIGLALKGLGVLIYIILWIVVPKARTTAEKLQMRGKPVNLSTIKNSVNAEYDKVKSSVSGFSKSPAGDRTRNALENLMQAFGLVIVAIFRFIIGAIGVLFLIIGTVFLACMIMFLLGFTSIFGHWQIWNGTPLPDIWQVSANSGHYYLMLISFIILVLIPIVVLIYAGIKILFNIKTKHRTLRAFVLTTWILALIMFVILLIADSQNFTVEASGSQAATIETPKYPKLYLEVRDNTAHKKMTVYSIFHYKFNYSEWDESLYSKPELYIGRSTDDQIHLNIEKHVKNVGINNSQQYLDRIEYSWEQQDSAIYLDRFMRTDDEDFWIFGEVDIRLQIPENQVVVLTQQACDLLNRDQQSRYCTDSLLSGKESVMTADGLILLKKQKRPVMKNK